MLTSLHGTDDSAMRLTSSAISHRAPSSPYFGVFFFHCCIKSIVKLSLFLHVRNVIVD